MIYKSIGIILLLCISTAESRVLNYPCLTKDACLKIEIIQNNILHLSGTVGDRDSERVRRALTSRIAEVHLKSGGGASAEGMKLGLLFREKNSFVRVASGENCASACTVAFLGGKIRKIDDDADFQVHIYSLFMKGFDRFNNYNYNLKPTRGFNWRKQILKDPQKFLLTIYLDLNDLEVTKQGYLYTEDYRSTRIEDKSSKVARRFSYLQHMIQSANKSLNINSIYSLAERLTNKLRSKRIQSFEFYVDNQLQKDVKMIELGGLSAAHSIAMRLERDSAFNLIGGVCEINEGINQGPFLSSRYAPEERADKLFSLCKTSRYQEDIISNNLLGDRSNFALRMIITMFESRITGLSVLNQETLFNYGFVNVK